MWIPMSWVYGHKKYFYSYSAGIDFRRQNTKVDPRAVRVKSAELLPCVCVIWSSSSTTQMKALTNTNGNSYKTLLQ